VSGAIMALGIATAPGANAQFISYQQVLDRPDDPALNLQFARQEIASGRLQQAASALERLLLNRPNWDSVRLLYGIVLYRMDDLENAKLELYKLEGRSLPSSQEADRLRYLGIIERETASIRITGRVSVGGRYDDNPGLVSDFIKDAVVDPGGGGPLLTPIPGMYDEEDVGLIGTARIRIEGDIEGAPGSVWFLQADGGIINFMDIDRADNASSSIKAGVSLKFDRLIVEPYAIAKNTWLQQEEFNDRWGGGVNIRYRVNPQLMLFGNLQFLNEDYNRTDFSIFNDERDGDITSGNIGVVWRATESQSFTVSAFAADKNAENEGYSFEQTGIAVNSLTLLGKGAYLSLSGRYSEVEYDQGNGHFTDPFAFFAREDERYFARAAIGAPLETIFGEQAQLPEFFKDVVMQVGVTWTRLDSNSEIIDYQNTSGDILFTKKFAF
ncbi:MAG: tetratricopeptide repeat protein, partial [Salaquimonas sp.]